MVKNYEHNITEPPLDFCDDYKPIPAPRTKKQVIKKPVPQPRHIIKETKKALKGYTASYEISIKNKEDPLIQLQIIRKAVETHIDNVLASIKGLKFIETLNVKFKKTGGKALPGEKDLNTSIEQDSFGNDS